MKKAILVIFISLLTTLSTFSFAQTPKRTESEENLENAKIIITGTIGIIDRITCKIKTKKSEKKLQQWRLEGRVDVDCWYINNNGDLTQDNKYDCWIGDYHYGETWCSICKELQQKELEKQKTQKHELEFKEQRETEHEIEIKRQYVDLGLPSGTLWKKWNENELYEYQDAINQFGNQIPTKNQWEELMNLCHWKMTSNGFTVIGPNGESVDFSVDGFTMCDQADKQSVGSLGIYTSSTLSDDSDFIWSVVVGNDKKFGGDISDCWKKSVRLVR